MRHNEHDTSPRARIPADVDTPDKIVYGLTARQLAILAVAGVAGYGLFKTVGPLVRQPVLIAMLIPIAGAAVVLALGRRDGLSMDVWLLAAIRHSRGPKRLAPAQPDRAEPMPAWAPGTAAPVPPIPVLRLPSRAIAESGGIDTRSPAVAPVACTTGNIGLRTRDQQNPLIGP